MSTQQSEFAPFNDSYVRDYWFPGTVIDQQPYPPTRVKAIIAAGGRDSDDHVIVGLAENGKYFLEANLLSDTVEWFDCLDDLLGFLWKGGKIDGYIALALAETGWLMPDRQAIKRDLKLALAAAASLPGAKLPA